MRGGVTRMFTKQGYLVVTKPAGADEQDRLVHRSYGADFLADDVHSHGHRNRRAGRIQPGGGPVPLMRVAL